MNIGDVEAEPEATTQGYIDVTTLPTGQPEQIPITIIQGTEPEPVLWVTGTIHGDEVTSTSVIHDLISQDLADNLQGTIVCAATLNPAGLRRTARTSPYHGDDPNRYFPAQNLSPTRTPRLQELINTRLFDRITASADAVISLHTSWVGSLPFSLVPRVPYGNDRSKSDARVLADSIHALAEAFGLPVVNQLREQQAIDSDRRRTLAGALVAKAGIPAFTPELGGRLLVNDSMTNAGVSGVKNVLRELDMLPGATERQCEFSTPVDYPVRFATHPRTDTAGIVQYRVNAGDVVGESDPIADIVTPNAEHKTTVKSEQEGFVLGRHEGIAKYESDPLIDMAVRDETNDITSL